MAVVLPFRRRWVTPETMLKPDEDWLTVRVAAEMGNFPLAAALASIQRELDLGGWKWVGSENRIRLAGPR